jgi:Putative auto-transporter adhesin, head GIN domain
VLKKKVWPTYSASKKFYHFNFKTLLSMKLIKLFLLTGVLVLVSLFQACDNDPIIDPTTGIPTFPGIPKPPPGNWTSAADTAKQPGAVRTPRTVGGFNKIKINNALVVVLRQGATASVQVEALPDVAPGISTEVVDNELIVTRTQCCNSANFSVAVGNNNNCVNLSGSQSCRVVVYVTVPQLDQLTIGNAVRVYASGAFKSTAFQLNLGSASRLEGLSVEASKEVDVVVRDASRITNLALVTLDAEIELERVSSVEVSGVAVNQRIKASSSSQYLARKLLSDAVDVQLEAVSEAAVSVAKTLTGNLSSLSSLSYAGNPGTVTVTRDRTSRLIKL